MEKKSKKSIVIGITLLLLVTLTLLGLTYAYYRTRIIGNEEEKSVNVTSKLLEVTYSDDNAVITASNISPGYTTSKTFSVENTGNEIVSYGVKLDNIESSFARTNDWTFTISKNGEIIKENKELPISESYLLNNETIAADGIDEYTLTIKYANLENEDQSEDMGKSLSLRINIDELTGTIFESAESGTLLAAIANDNLIGKPMSTPGLERSITKGYIGIRQSSSYTYTYSASRPYITYADSYVINDDATFTLVNPQVGHYLDIYNNLQGKYIVGSGSSTPSIASSTELERVEYVASATAAEMKIFREFSVGKGYESVLASTEDDYGTSYYFRGGVDNNYVNYAGMCWRIVRVQGNGTIKIALADRDNECNSSSYSIQHNSFSAVINNSTKYSTTIGSLDNFENFKYENSEIVEILSTWMTDKSLDTTKLAETEWCTDLSVYKDESFGYDSTETEVYDKELAKYWYPNFYFGAYERLSLRDKSSGPTLKCNLTGLNDTTSVKYKNNIGILTADEVAFAGATSKGNEKYGYYLMDNANDESWNGYWTMTPYGSGEDIIEVLNKGVYIATVYGNFLADSITGDMMVRPVVVLRSDITITTNSDTATYGLPGTQSNPYVVD